MQFCTPFNTLHTFLEFLTIIHRNFHCLFSSYVMTMLFFWDLFAILKRNKYINCILCWSRQSSPILIIAQHINCGHLLMLKFNSVQSAHSGVDWLQAYPQSIVWSRMLRWSSDRHVAYLIFSCSNSKGIIPWVCWYPNDI